jgi:hypothetical protein
MFNCIACILLSPQTRVWLMVCGFTLVFGPMLAKSWRVHQIFRNAGVKRVVSEMYPYTPHIYTYTPPLHTYTPCIHTYHHTPHISTNTIHPSSPHRSNVPSYTPYIPTYTSPPPLHSFTHTQTIHYTILPTQNPHSQYPIFLRPLHPPPHRHPT